MESKGFAIAVDGRMKEFPAGADVPAELASEYGLVAKGLVVKPAKKGKDKNAAT